MSDEIRPALTPQEWSSERIRMDWGGAVRIGHRGPQLCYDEDQTFHWLGEGHALAALCLYQQSFGFSRADLEWLDEVAALAASDREMGELTEDEEQEAQAIVDQRRLQSLRNRIAALLPPEEK